jgi:hypothetical protein
MERSSKIWILAGCAFLLIIGCGTDTKPTNAKLEKGLNAYFETHNECLFPTPIKFPYEVSPGANAKEEAQRMNALTKAGLLERQSGAAIHVERYTLTPLGERQKGRFCYGHRQVAGIDEFTPPMKQNGFLETRVKYHAAMMDVPVWAKTDEMRAAFPQMATAISGPQPGEITMQNAGAGWRVPF